MSPTTPIHPLLFEPIYKEKVWGGRALEKLGRTLPPPPAKIGESWELADLATTSPSGGGGGSAYSRIVNPRKQERTFHDAIREQGKALLGDLLLDEFGQFPLLVKFLDANENLSVQVHPSAEYAAAHKDAYLKSEAWYVLDCRPGSCIYKGILPGVTREQFRAAIERNEVEPLLVKVPVQAGDCHYLPSGTCHALGAGVLVAEVQTPSDTTFRVYDWGRTDRQLHIEQALACMMFPAVPAEPAVKPVHVAGESVSRDRLVRCEYFNLDRLKLEAGNSLSLKHVQPQVWMVLAGAGRITGDFDAVALTQGVTVYLPPRLSRAVLHAAQAMTWLQVTFPQAEDHRMA
ncbi:MAG: class I mannose-6-phosphate isomerase [Phycisphaeraceae bacterium]|nr:class I mannose-6-phosphate isomerase [Phycisphaeraceae bacterium]